MAHFFMVFCSSDMDSDVPKAGRYAFKFFFPLPLSKMKVVCVFVLA